MHALERFSEKRFKEIITEVGPYNYRLYEKGESLPGEVLGSRLEINDYNPVIIGTGASASAYKLFVKDIFNGGVEPEIIIPKNSPVMLARLLRYDDTHGKPHYNATDQLFFSSEEGDVYRLVRTYPPDHVIKITENTNIISIASAFKLPDKKSGSVLEYTTDGAQLYIEVNPFK